MSGSVQQGSLYWDIESQTPTRERTVAVMRNSNNILGLRGLNRVSMDRRFQFIIDVMQKTDTAAGTLLFDVYNLSYETWDVVQYKPMMSYSFEPDANGEAINDTIRPTGYFREEIQRGVHSVIRSSEPQIRTILNLPRGVNILPSECANRWDNPGC